MKGNKIYIQQNADKSKNESWLDANHGLNDILNFPCPSRILIMGTPNSGKTLLVKNLLVHTKPHWNNVFLLHQECWDPSVDDSNIVDKVKKNIEEYKGLKAVYLKSIPPTKFWDQFAGQKNCLIIDDVDIKSYANSAIRRDRVNKLFSYVSTHRKLTIISSFQDVNNQGSTTIKRFSNVFVLFPIRDKDLTWRIGRSCGLDGDIMDRLMKLLNTSHDNICIDCTNDSPAPLRLNMTNIIEIDDESIL